MLLFVGRRFSLFIYFDRNLHDGRRKHAGTTIVRSKTRAFLENYGNVSHRWGLSPEYVTDRFLFFFGLARRAEDISEDSTRVFADGANRWLVRDTRLAQMSLNTDWEYYGAVDRFLKVIS